MHIGTMGFDAHVRLISHKLGNLDYRLESGNSCIAWNEKEEMAD
jgi:hypothetical protein